MQNEKIKELYNIVFNNEGNIKLCGRDVCIKLIKMMSQGHPDIDFGNPETGFLNTENIKNYYNTDR